MRQVAKKGLITMAAAGGVLAVAGGYAHAGSGASGAATSSPGVLSGNNLQVPVHVPLNACGNTVDVVGALNPAVGNRCANIDGPGGVSTSDKQVKPGDSGEKPGDGGKAIERDLESGSGTTAHRPRPQGTTGERSETTRVGGGARAQGGAHGSPGVGSGNQAQVPAHVPANACGNTINVVGLLNPTHRNKCANNGAPETRHTPHQPPTGEREEVTPPKPKPEPRPEGKPRPEPEQQHPAPEPEQQHPRPEPEQQQPTPHPEPQHPRPEPEQQQPTPGPGAKPDPRPQPAEQPRPEQPPGPWVQTPPQTETHMERGAELPASRSERSRNPIEQAPRAAAEVADQLAATGAGPLAIALPASAGMLLAGTVLYRRARAA